MDEAEKFFYEHAGWSHNLSEETSEEGRRRSAAELAAAERRLNAGPFFVLAEPDPEPWDGDFPYDGPLWIVSLYWASEESAEAECVGSLSAVAAESGADPYIRVAAAELALEYIEDSSDDGI